MRVAVTGQRAHLVVKHRRVTDDRAVHAHVEDIGTPWTQSWLTGSHATRHTSAGSSVRAASGVSSGREATVASNDHNLVILLRDREPERRATRGLFLDNGTRKVPPAVGSGQPDLVPLVGRAVAAYC